jgi:hypothetical protein
MRTGMISVLLLVLAVTLNLVAQNQPRSLSTAPKLPLAGRLLGTWRLVSIGSIRPDGTLEALPELGPHAIGYLMYDTTGHMCVSLANPNHPQWVNPEKPTAAERLHSFDAMFAYCGTYEVQESEHRVIHRPEMSSWPHYIGTDQFRNIRMEGDRLILFEKETPPNGELHEYQIAWERVKKQGQ